MRNKKVTFLFLFDPLHYGASFRIEWDPLSVHLASLRTVIYVYLEHDVSF